MVVVGESEEKQWCWLAELRRTTVVLGGGEEMGWGRWVGDFGALLYCWGIWQGSEKLINVGLLF